MCHTHIFDYRKRIAYCFDEKKTVQMKLDDRGNMKKKNTVCVTLSTIVLTITPKQDHF